VVENTVTADDGAASQEDGTEEWLVGDRFGRCSPSSPEPLVSEIIRQQ